MTLKAVLDTLEGVEATIQPLYTKGQDNKFYLGVEGMVPSTRLDEFRTNNIDLKKALEKFEGVDVEKYHILTELERKQKEKQLIDAGDVDKVVEERVKALRTESEGRIAELSKSNESLNMRLSSVLIDSTVKSSAVAAGALPTGVDDVVLRAKAVFQMKDGAVVPVDSKGNIIYGKDGSTPLGIDEWVANLKKVAPHLFEFMKGSGAGGGVGAGVDTSKMSSTQKISAGLSS